MAGYFRNTAQWKWPSAQDLLRARRKRNNQSLAKKVELRRLTRQFRKEDEVKERKQLDLGPLVAKY